MMMCIWFKVNVHQVCIMKERLTLIFIFFLCFSIFFWGVGEGGGKERNNVLLTGFLWYFFSSLEYPGIVKSQFFSAQ